MKKLSNFLKTLLVAVGIGVGSSAWGDGTKHILYSQDYESTTFTDWASNDGNKDFATGDATYGKYAQCNYQGNGNRDFYYNIPFLFPAASGYTTASMNTVGYTVEFDVKLCSGNNSGNSKSQFIVTTASNPALNTNAAYSGTEYIFSLSQPTRDSGSRSTTWYVNDLTETTDETVDISYDNWVHVKLVVTASSVSYVLKNNSTGEDLKSGCKSVDALPVITGFFTLVGRGSGFTYFDNLELYNYSTFPEMTQAWSMHFSSLATQGVSTEKSDAVAFGSSYYTFKSDYINNNFGVNNAAWGLRKNDRSTTGLWIYGKTGTFAVNNVSKGSLVTIRSTGTVSANTNATELTGFSDKCFQATTSGFSAFNYASASSYVRSITVYNPVNEIVGLLDKSSGYMGQYKTMTISEGETVNLHFRNRGNSSENWYNWALRFYNGSVDFAYRADNCFNGTDWASHCTTSIKMDGGDINWTTFKSQMTDAEVDMTITYTPSGMLSISATSEGNTNVFTHSGSYNTAISGALTLELGVDHSWLEVTSYKKTYTASFTENNSLDPTVTIYSDSERTEEVTNGELEDETTYYYTASLDKYIDSQGSFTVNGANPSVNFTMSAYLSEFAESFTNGGSLVAGTWYKYTIPWTTAYTMTAGSNLSNIVYTTDGTQLYPAANTEVTTAFSSSENLTKDVVCYFKSSEDQTLDFASDMIYTKPLAEWSSSDVTTTENTLNKWYNANGIVGSTSSTGMMIDADKGLRICASRTTSVATLKTNHVDNTIVTVDAIWNVGNSTNDANTPYGTFTFGDLTITQRVRSNDCGTYYKINGKTVNLGKDKFTKDDDMTIHLKVDSYTGDIKEFYIKNGNTTIAQFSDLTSDNNHFAVASDYSKISILACAPAGSGSQQTYNYLKTLTIEEKSQDLDIATITFKYEDLDGHSLSAYSPDRIIYADIDATISDLIVSPYNDIFYNGTSNKYVYHSYVVTGDYTTVQESGNTVTLKFKDYPATAYTVNAIVNKSSVKTLASGTAYFDGTTTVNISKYILGDDDKWYMKSSSPYSFVITTSTNDIDYTEADKNIYDFIECENTTYTTAGDQTASSASGGKGVLLNSGSAMSTKSKIPAGIYDISVYGYVRRANEDQLKLQYSTDNSVWNDIEVLTFEDSKSQTPKAEKVVLTDDSYIRFLDVKGQNSCHYYDYIILEKFVSKTITSVGWATYCSPYALDLTEDITNLTDAYIVTGGTGDKEGVLLKTSVKGGTVPANTGLLLKGTAGTVTIPVVASSSTEVSSNKLVGVTSSTVIDAKTGYVLMNDASNGLNFYLNNNAFTVGANTAYLPANFTGGSARAAFYSFDDETTGINVNDNLQLTTDNSVYNLQGQRIDGSRFKVQGSSLKSGLYIINGKKVIVK